MAWSPPAHNAGIVWVSAPGDYATFNSNHTPDGTGLIAPRTDDRGCGDASGRRHPLPRCAAPTLGKRRYNRSCAGRDELSLAAHERGAVDAGQFPSFTCAAERQGLLTGTTG